MAACASNPEVDAFLSRAGAWREEMTALREIVAGCGLDEALKWGQPCYSVRSKNIVLIHAFKEYCALLFMKGALMRDPEGLLVQQTENVRSARQIRFRSLEEIVGREYVLRAYVGQAVAVEEAGLRVEKAAPEATPLPEELSARFAAEPALAAAFAKLTPGRRRAYLLHFGAAKQAKTRLARIAACAPQILAGLGLDDA